MPKIDFKFVSNKKILIYELTGSSENQRTSQRAGWLINSKKAYVSHITSVDLFRVL